MRGGFPRGRGELALRCVGGEVRGPVLGTREEWNALARSVPAAAAPAEAAAAAAVALFFLFIFSVGVFFFLAFFQVATGFRSSCSNSCCKWKRHLFKCMVKLGFCSLPCLFVLLVKL